MTSLRESKIFDVPQNYDRFLNGIASFVAVAFPAAIVNSGLKFMQKQIQLSFMRRLTHHLHEKYCANRAYYAASVLGGKLSFPCSGYSDKGENAMCLYWTQAAALYFSFINKHIE